MIDIANIKEFHKQFEKDGILNPPHSTIIELCNEIETLRRMCSNLLDGIETKHSFRINGEIGQLRDYFDRPSSIDHTQPHPPSRFCFCKQCKPSFEQNEIAPSRS
jgi:hypothetical protein